MLTRKPSAAAPAAYPTGKEGPAGPRPARASPRGAGARYLRDLEQSLRRGGSPADGAPASLRSLLRAGPGLLRGEPRDPAGRAGSLASHRPGSARRRRPGQRSHPAPGLRRLQRGPPSRAQRGSRGVANSRTRARLNFAAARAQPSGERRGPVSRPPGVTVPCLPRGERASPSRGVGRGRGGRVPFSPPDPLLSPPARGSQAEEGTAPFASFRLPRRSERAPPGAEWGPARPPPSPCRPSGPATLRLQPTR
ncbi:hypothetical protein QTO34_017338 [Cnephaeus nilssonii]|uniref:Uncharacterized protein n=1 Tax=Cnephaeus nilssonii TaxID=3371016 RepID=A0AA40I0W5_CNENI|nr:hypothetical protein QTO34_017338 [Eptesicus nilssonii]